MLTAERGSTTYGILSNRYLEENARTVSYSATISLYEDGWGYQEDSVLEMSVLDEPLHHTARNRLFRVDD